MHFRIMYEFNEAKTLPVYEKYLTEVVTQKIPQGGTVMIHGHTDIIGEEPYNKDLSMKRANDVKGILEKSLSNAGRTDVKIEVYGFGEDTVGVSTYNAMLKDVESVVRYSNVGLDGFMRWSFLNRGNLDGQWQFVNTWNSKKQCFLSADSILPQSIPFYTWGLLSRYVTKHAIVQKTTVGTAKEKNVQRIFAAMYKAPDSDNFTLVIINDGDNQYDSKIDLSVNIKKKLNKIQVTPSLFGNKHTGEINCKVKPYKKNDLLQLPAKSITIISTYLLNYEDKGVF